MGVLKNLPINNILFLQEGDEILLLSAFSNQMPLYKHFS